MSQKAKRKRAQEAPPMAGPSKKRTCAPTHPRTPSPEDDEEHYGRVESVYRSDRDPYWPGDDTMPAVPTPNDWNFRLKVACMEHAPGELLKEAVQGLVKICFPNDFAKELGINVVEAQMRKAGASERSIAKVAEIFESEMIHRLSWMLAAYLDTPQKMEKGVSSVASASNRLQGNKIDHRVLNQLIFGFTQLRDQVATKSSLHEHELHRYEPSKGASVSAHQHPSADEHSSSVAHVEAPVPPAKDRNCKISKTWRWAVEKEDVNAGNISNHFQTRTDLFAYHALPIAQSQVGEEAGRRQLRMKIEELLLEVTDEYAEKWEQCFSELKNGNLCILDRVASETEDPGDCNRGNRPLRGTSVSLPGKRKERKGKTRAGCHPPSHVLIKTEEDHVDMVDALRGGTHGEVYGVYGTVPAFQRMSIDNRSTEPKATPDTPVVDLLWGVQSFSDKDENQVLARLMDQLNLRVPEQEIESFTQRGSKAVLTKHWLKKDIEFTLKRSPFNHGSARGSIDRELQHWVVQKTERFPELARETFVFSMMVPYLSPVLELLMGTDFCLNNHSTCTIISQIENILKQKGISLENRASQMDSTLKAQLHALQNLRYAVLRGKLERILRIVAFQHRAMFPELKDSILVKTWESKTGQTW